MVQQCSARPSEAAYSTGRPVNFLPEHYFRALIEHG